MNPDSDSNPAIRETTTECAFCAFPLPVELASKAKHAQRIPSDSPRCAICLDGRADPWAIVREIRRLFGAGASLPGAGTPVKAEAKSVDTFEIDAGIIWAAVSAFWPELASIDVPKASMSRSDIEEQLRQCCGYDARAAKEMVSLLLAYHERFHGHWAIISEAVVRRWPEVPSEEIGRLDGTVSALAALIAQHTASSVGGARSEIMELLTELHFGALVGIGEHAGATLRGYVKQIAGDRRSGPDRGRERAR